MKRCGKGWLIIALMALSTDTVVQEVAREELGRKEKLRILVDKVMQPEEGWVTKEWIVREAAEAGFNVFSPRRGHENLQEVRQVTEWCEQYGLYHMPWMRGSLIAPDGSQATGKRVLWANGNEQLLWSACSDEFWEWTTQYIVEYAKISAQNPHLMGVFLDYENYAPGPKGGNLYFITYEDVILRPFLESKGLELPIIKPAERKTWLEDQGLHEEFEKFQIEHWRRRCRKLREAVDKYNPAFQFCLYPAPGTPFMVQACYPEWSTPTAPLILADASTYGRSSRFMPQADALEQNLQRLQRGMQTPQKAGISFIYVGGIDPLVVGADPEFCGKNAVMISEVAGGYWVFYEGPKYHVEHPHYFQWFKWANRNIVEHAFAAWHEPREEPEEVLDLFSRLALPEVTGQVVKFGKHTLRGENLVLVAAKQDQPVEIVLRNVPVAAYQAVLSWEVRDANLHKIASGTVPYSEEGFVRFTPSHDGLYLLFASAGSCAYSFISSNAPLGLFARHGVSFIYGAERFYFHVPEGLEKFVLTAKGSGIETVRVNVFNDEGQLTATEQTTPNEPRIEVPVEVGKGHGKTWSLSTAKADAGVLEDNVIFLDANLPPVLSLVAEHVFKVVMERE